MITRILLLSLLSTLSGCVGFVFEVPKYEYRDVSIIQESPDSYFSDMDCKKTQVNVDETLYVCPGYEQPYRVEIAFVLAIVFDYEVKGESQFVVKDNSFVSWKRMGETGYGFLFGLVPHEDVLHFCKYGGPHGLEYCGH